MATRGRSLERASRQSIWKSRAMGAKRSGNSARSKSNSAGSNSTRVRKRLDSASPCSSLNRMLPWWRKMKSAMVATIPLRSGQETSRMAEVGMDTSDSTSALCDSPCARWFKEFFTTETTAGHRARLAVPRSLLQRLGNLARGVSAGAAGEARSRMRSTAAQIQAVDRCLVACPVEQGAHSEELIEREFTVEDMAAGEPVGFFEIPGRDDLPVQDGLRQIRRVLRDGVHHGFAECGALALPVAVFQFIGRVLHVDGHHMLPSRRERRMRKRRNRNLKIWIARKGAVLRCVEGPLQVIDLRADLDTAAEQVAVALGLEPGELRKRGQREIDFRDRPLATVVLDFLNEVGREVSGIDQTHQRAFGVGVRDHGARGNFFPRLEHDASGDAIIHANLGDVSVGANFR